MSIYKLYMNTTLQKVFPDDCEDLAAKAYGTAIRLHPYWDVKLEEYNRATGLTRTLMRRNAAPPCQAPHCEHAKPFGKVSVCACLHLPGEDPGQNKSYLVCLLDLPPGPDMEEF